MWTDNQKDHRRGTSAEEQSCTAPGLVTCTSRRSNSQASRARSLCESVGETGSAWGCPHTRRSLPGGSGHCKSAKIKQNALWQIHGHKVVTVWIKSRKASGQSGNGVITRGLEGDGWILLQGMGTGMESCCQQCNKIQSRISHSLIFLPNWHVPLRNNEFFYLIVKICAKSMQL